MAKGANRHIPYIVDYMSDELGRLTHMVCDGQKYILTGFPKTLGEWLKKRGIHYKTATITAKDNPVALGTRMTLKIPPEFGLEFREEWLRELIPGVEPELVGPRSCVTKKRYLERAHADRDMFLLLTAATYVARPGRTLRVYTCQHCGGFHVGHQESGTTPYQPTYDTPKPVPRERP